jgi:hypothetical protein
LKQGRCGVNAAAFRNEVPAAVEKKEEAMGLNHVLAEIGHGVGVAVKDVVQGAEEVLTVGGKVLRVIADVRAMSPEFKSNLAILVDDAKAIAVPLAPVVAGGGENVAADLAALAPVTEGVLKLVRDFLAFLPSVEAALKKVNADMANARTSC